MKTKKDKCEWCQNETDKLKDAVVDEGEKVRLCEACLEHARMEVI